MKALKRLSARLSRTKREEDKLQSGSLEETLPDLKEPSLIKNTPTRSSEYVDRICNVCRVGLWVVYPERDHHQSLAALRASSRTCPSCQLILAAISNPNHLLEQIKSGDAITLKWESMDDNGSKLKIQVGNSNIPRGHFALFAKKGELGF